MAQKVLIPPSRHISTSYQDLLEDLAGDAGTGSSDLYQAVAEQLDMVALNEFHLVRRRMKHAFKPFSDAGSGHKANFHGLTGEEVDEEEASFLRDLFSLLEAAHFRVLSRGDWDAACNNEFTFTNPMEVAWGAMDKTLLKRFWSERPDQFANAASISDKVLVMSRGIHLARAKGRFIEDKIDLLVLYLVAEPFERLARPFLERTLKRTWKDLWPRISVEDTVRDVGIDRHRAVKEDIHIEQRAQTRNPLLDHDNAQVVERVTLKDVMPNAGSVLRSLLKEITIQEPAFDTTVILYRRQADSEAKQQDEKAPIKNASAEELKRNIHIKRFQDVPLADLEMIFPDKKVYLKPLLLLQLFITIFIGLVSVLITFITTEASWSLLGAVASIIATRAYTVYSSATLGRQTVLDQITDRLYDQTMDAQDGVIYYLLDQMADQHVKEQMLAYFTLLSHGEGLSGEGLDQACEGYLKGRFGERKDFACQETLPSLLSYGLVTKDAQGNYRAVPISEGRKVLSELGQRLFALGDEKLLGHLAVLNNISQKKLKTGKASSRSTGILSGLPLPHPEAGSVQTSQPKMSITPPDLTGQLPALKEERDSNLVAGLVGGAKSMFTGGSKKTA